MPSNKVVVGVTSYGRSFAMADAGCHTEQCQFTGTATQSDANAGPCTGTAGYISDAEIKAIIKSKHSRVNQNYNDTKSDTSILVYNDTQWVSWMSPEQKRGRKSFYTLFNMGGTSDWASDLEDYHDAPLEFPSWKTFTQVVKQGVDPRVVGFRTGNWTSIHCNDPCLGNLENLTPKERWDVMDCANAWKDAINVWKHIDRPRGGGPQAFSQSVSRTVQGPPDGSCGSVDDVSNCEQTLPCPDFVGYGAGAASYEIWDSLVYIHEVCAIFPCPAGRLTENEQLLVHFSCTPAFIMPYTEWPVSLPPSLRTSRTRLHRSLRPTIITGSSSSWTALPSRWPWQ